jgi:hypothetical protein
MYFSSFESWSHALFIGIHVPTTIGELVVWTITTVGNGHTLSVGSTQPFGMNNHSQWKYTTIQNGHNHSECTQPFRISVRFVTPLSFCSLSNVGLKFSPLILTLSFTQNFWRNPKSMQFYFENFQQSPTIFEINENILADLENFYINVGVTRIEPT